ncbi:MAG: asparagine--tRNA ligase [Chlamydiota bacterium]
MQKVLIKHLLKEDTFLGKTLTVTGWIRSLREQKHLCFLQINDGSYFDSLQIVADDTLPGYHDLLPKLITGAAIEVEGVLVKSSGKQQPVEMRPTTIALIGASSEEYPLQKKRHSFEYLRTIAHLRPRTNTQGACLRIRSLLSYAVHTFFQEKEFVHIHTPILTALDCEGAGDLFQVQKNGKHFFGAPAYLNVSGQLEAEICALALSNVYTFGPTFRAENSHTSRHLSEFWMIEPEMAFCDLAQDMDIAEEFIKYVTNYVLDKGERDLAFFDTFIEKGLLEKLGRLTSKSFARMSYTEAIAALQKAKKAFVFSPDWGCDLQSEHERYLAEEFCEKPVFIHDYPKEIKAFYMKDGSDGKTVKAMDLLVPGIGELIGGSQREDRLDLLEEKMRNKGLNPAEYWWYIDLRKYGSCPHSGFGVGFERLIQMITGLENIRDVIPFPRYPGHAEF